MTEELDEVVDAMEEEDVEQIAKELSDLLYAVYGTIGVYGLAEKMPAIFDEIHNSHMTKESGGKGLKAIKGPSFKEANIREILHT